MILCEILTDHPSFLPAVSTILGVIFKVKPEKKSILRVLNFSFCLQTYALSGSKDNITEENFHIQNFYFLTTVRIWLLLLLKQQYAKKICLGVGGCSDDITANRILNVSLYN